MVPRIPSGGVGSNQYQTKPGTRVESRREQQSAFESLSGGQGSDAELIAVAFSPDGLAPWRAWHATSEEIRSWHQAFSGAETAVWLIGRPDITPGQAAQLASHFPRFGHWARWSELEIPTSDLARWVEVFPPALGQGNVLRDWNVKDRDPSDVRRLISQTPFISAAEHQFWSTQAVNPVTAMNQAWSSADQADGGSGVADHEKGFLREWARPDTARTAGIIDPAQWKAWRTAAVAHHGDGGHPLTVHVAAKLISAGVNPGFAVDHLRALTGEAFDDTVAADFVTRGWNESPDVAAVERLASIDQVWHDLQSSPVPWIAYGFTPDEAIDWEHAPAFNSDDGWYDGPHVGWDTALLAEYRDAGFPITEREWVNAIYTADLPTTHFALRAARFIRDRGGTSDDFTRFCHQTGL